jgi:hypothetical protein
MEPTDFAGTRDEVRKSILDVKRRQAAMEVALRDTLTIDPMVTIGLGRMGNQMFRIEFDLRAAKEFFKETGKLMTRFGDITDDDLDNPETVALLLHLGMLRNHPDAPTPNEVMDLVTIPRFGYVKFMLTKALSAILPDPEVIMSIALETEQEDNTGNSSGPFLVEEMGTSGGSGPSAG